MNVLSLFDGMSCGQIALERCGINVDNYFASEIDKYAITVTTKNYPNTLHIGNIIDVNVSKLPKIDLLIGGSSCQNFSFAGNRKGMSTEQNIEILDLDQYLELKEQNVEFSGESYLFWEYIRILKELNPRYFLLENVIMSKKWEAVITNAVGVNPIKINSNLLVPQSRNRLYWTNIPNVTQPIKNDYKLADILENFIFDREPYEEKYKSNIAVNYKSKHFNTIRANAGSKTRGIGICNDDGWWRKLTPIECERLQTVPDNYSDGVSNSQRYKMLGNGWTVDVISHILKNIKNINE